MIFSRNFVFYKNFLYGKFIEKLNNILNSLYKGSIIYKKLNFTHLNYFKRLFI